MNSIPQTGPYVPRSNESFGNWLAMMSQGIANDPARYGLSPADGDVLVQQAQLFFAAHALTTTPSTRTEVTINDRDSIRSCITPLFTGFAQRIKHSDGVSDPDKIAIGVRPRKRSHTKRAVPLSSPSVMIFGAGNGGHTLRYHDSMTPNSPAKPFGAVCLQLFVDITDGTRKPSIDEARFFGSYTRNLFGVAFEPKDSGKQATYWGRWANRRGDVGPWSFPVSFTIAWGAAGEGPVAKAQPDDVQSLKLAA